MVLGKLPSSKPINLWREGQKGRRFLFGASVVSGLVFLLNLGGVPDDVATWASWLEWLNGHRSHWLIFGITAVAWLVLTGWLGLALRDTTTRPQPEEATTPTARPSDSLSIKETSQLAAQFTKTSKAIYAFLDKHAMREDEPKVVAEYRRKFDAKVMSLCLNLTSAGLSDTEHLKNAMKPPTSVDDIQWIARILSAAGENYSGERLAKYQAQAIKDLDLDPAIANFDLEEGQKRLAELEELLPFTKEHPGAGPDTLAALELWMDREEFPEFKRSRMRATMERTLNEMEDEGSRFNV
jgi:hypothetical protein